MVTTSRLSSWYGAVDIAQLVLVTFLVGVAGMFFSIANRSALPHAVPEAMLSRAFARQESVTTVIDIAAPLIVGQLIRAFTAPVVIIPAAIARILSAAFSGRIRLAAEPDAEGREPFGPAMRTGLRFSLRNVPVRTIVLSTALMNFGLALGSSVQTLYYVHTIHLSPGEIGMVLTGAGIGSLLGTLVAPQAVSALGEVGVFRLSSLVLIPIVAALPLMAGLGGAVVLLIAAQAALYSVAVVIYNVNSYTLAAKLTPKNLLGRQMSFMGFAGMGVVPIGSIIGGVLGDSIGLTSTLWIWAGTAILAAMPSIFGGTRIRGALPTTDHDVPDPLTAGTASR
ncbi:MAG TPA: MFS transporter [Lacisediminihabitans sp.]|uniref:MFS transporter n=1 Tax=Lacisediminihabitans sp. TaxID=2787631 RepID=UPI002ED8718C